MSSILSSSSLSILSMDLCFDESTASSFISSSSSSMAAIELVLSDQDDNDNMLYNIHTQPLQPSQRSKSAQSSDKHSKWSHSSTKTDSVAYIYYNVPRSPNPFTTKESIPTPATISNPFNIRTPSISISPTITNSKTDKISACGAFYSEQKSDINSANKSRKTLKQKIAESRAFFNAKNVRTSRPKPPRHQFNYFTNMATFIDGEDDEYPELPAHNIKSSLFVKSGLKRQVTYFSWNNDEMVNDILLGGDESKRKFCFV